MTGGKFALLTAGLALGACANGSSKLTIKPVGESAADMVRSGDGLAVARGQLALNNVGLALEEFRKVQLQRPNDPAPLAGIADCYAVMGRYDLAQSNYESALALAPRDPKLLLGLAQIFELQGDSDRAAAARAEAQVILQVSQPALAAVARPLPTPMIAEASPKPVAAVGSLTVELPPVRAAAVQHSAVQIAAATGSVTVALPPARPVVQTAAAAPVVQATPVVQASPAPVQQAALPSPAAPQMKPAVLDADLPLSVVAATGPLLPHAAPQPKLLASAITIKLPPAARSAPRPVANRVDASGPSLQRLSSGEVALVTGHGAWNAPLTVQPQAPTRKVQWIALNGASTGIQIINAGRRQGLAAGARTVLLQRGWHGIAVATAGHMVEHSYIMYPRSRSRLAKRLAAQFAIRTRVAHGRSIVLVLGRDRLGLARPQRQA